MAQWKQWISHLMGCSALAQTDYDNTFHAPSNLKW